EIGKHHQKACICQTVAVLAHVSVGRWLTEAEDIVRDNDSFLASAGDVQGQVADTLHGAVARVSVRGRLTSVATSFRRHYSQLCQPCVSLVQGLGRYDRKRFNLRNSTHAEK